jgi:hypothetical protein
MTKMCIKYWLVYCSSIDVQMVDTLSHSCKRLCQQPRTHTQAWKVRKIRRLKSKQTQSKYMYVHTHV